MLCFHIYSSFFILDLYFRDRKSYLYASYSNWSKLFYGMLTRYFLHSFVACDSYISQFIVVTMFFAALLARHLLKLRFKS